jgi:hypothetical protein
VKKCEWGLTKSRLIPIMNFCEHGDEYLGSTKEQFFLVCWVIIVAIHIVMYGPTAGKRLYKHVTAETDSW